MLKVTGLDQFKSATSAWLGEVRKATSEAAVGLAKRTFEKILYTSPQWSGDFVSSWKVSYGTPDYSFKEGVINLEGVHHIFQRGDMPAISYALHHAKWTPKPLGTTIYITNAARHGDDNYGWKIESGTIKLRPVNAGATRVMNRAAEFIQHRYAKIDAGKLTTLRKF